MGQRRLSDIADGSFVGVSGRYWLVLRVDVDRSVESKKVGAVSGDLQSTGPEEGAGYASFRSVGDVSPDDLGGAIDVEWTDAIGKTARGRVCVEPPQGGGDDAVQVRLETLGEIGGIPAEAGITMPAHRAGSAMRQLTVEFVVEEDVRLAVEENVGEDRTSAGLARLSDRLVQWWGRAGFAVDTRRAENRIPRPEAGWAESDIFATLQEAMERSASGVFDRPDWDVRLLVLSTADRRGLEGVMFDVKGPRPRQGAAIFVDAIRAREPDQSRAERMILKTAVHELGHALNLRHRFDPGVRRSRSRSPMTYDWLYPDGPNQYWAEYGEGSFDSDELAFLRHAPRSQVIPGGAAFGSAVYWEPGAGIVTDPVEPWRSLSLWLTPPAAGTRFAYGQPILLEVSLLNTGRIPVWVPQHVLDLKAGRLDILTRMVEDGAASGAVAAKPFTPMMQRCFSVAGAQGFELAYGESLHTNANLTYGSGGPEFPEPGLYELTPVLTFPATDEGLDHLVVGPTLQIRVEAPRSSSEERDGDTLLGRTDIGISLALGGSTCFQAAADELTEIRERRAREAAGGPPDPIAVALARVTGIFEGRKGNAGRAAGLLDQATTPEARRYFDPHTAEHTRRLAETYNAQLSATEPSPAEPRVVVVDLWTAPKAGGPLSGGRGSGFLTTRGAPSGGSPGSSTGDGWGVLAPASQLPPEAMRGDHTVAAVVTLASGNGVTQRVAGRRIDLVSESDGAEPTLALLELSHPVPGPPERPGDAPDPSLVRPGSDVASFFGGPDAYRVVSRTGARLDPWSEAADQALAEAPRPRNPLAPVPARVHTYPRTSLDDVAGWACRILGCQTPPPPPDMDTPYRPPLPAEPLLYHPEPPTDDDGPPSKQGPSQAGA
jgi:hypothetical protein